MPAHARELLQDERWPANWLFVLDPNYAFTEAYDIRGQAQGEPAYPSTFIIDRAQRVRFAPVSRTHGDRVDVDSALARLAEMKAARP